MHGMGRRLADAVLYGRAIGRWLRCADVQHGERAGNCSRSIGELSVLLEGSLKAS
jgi:hypothetical protein